MNWILRVLIYAQLMVHWVHAESGPKGIVWTPNNRAAPEKLLWRSCSSVVGSYNFASSQKGKGGHGGQGGGHGSGQGSSGSSGNSTAAGHSSSSNMTTTGHSSNMTTAEHSSNNNNSISSNSTAHGAVHAKWVVRASQLGGSGNTPNSTNSTGTAPGKGKGKSSHGPAKVDCKDPAYLGSMALCLYGGAQGDLGLVKRAMPQWQKVCGNVSYVDFEDIYTNATKHAIALNDTSATVKLPVKFVAGTYKKAYDNLYSRFLNQDRSIDYGYAILAYWFFVMIVSAVCKFLQVSGVVLHMRGMFWKKLQSTVGIPAVFGGAHFQRLEFLQYGRALVPTRAESVVIVLYLFVHLVVLVIQWHIVGTTDSTSRTVLRMLADRTGIIAFAHFPVMFLFAGRNNFLLFSTTFNYSAFIQFHKWTSRMMTINAIVHGICFAVLEIRRGIWARMLTEEYLIWGIVATCVASALCLTAYNYFRSHIYEVFLVTHIALAVVFTAAAFKHCEELGYMEFVIAAIAVWGFDRIVRVLRLMQFGAKRSQIAIVGDSTLKITVPKPKSWSSKPGQYAFVYFWTKNTFWQNHPFTIQDSTIQDGEIVIYIKKKSGLTSKIYAMIDVVPGKLVDNICVSLEGPYGHSAPNYHYDTAVLVAGGNGIPGPFDHAVKLAHRYPEGQKNVRLVWVARDLPSVGWFASELQLLKDTCVQVDIYLTREKQEAPEVAEVTSTYYEYNEKESSHLENVESLSNDEDDDEIKDEKVDPERQLKRDILSKINHFNIVYGRPDIDTLVREAIQTAPGSISITSCGPGVMCDSLRKSIAKYLVDSKHRVDYNEELQIW